MVAEVIDRPGSVIMLFFTADPGAGDPIACCHVQRDDAGSGYFGMFAVRPAAQGGGIGRFALAEAERQAAGWGCRRMRMTVISAREDLIAWYGRRGYRLTGEREPFPYGDERFGQPRRPDLEFAELVKDLA
jgi:GNAT superfamily N-acetyltransferase